MRRAALLLIVVLCGALLGACGGSHDRVLSRDQPRRISTDTPTRTTGSTATTRTAGTDATSQTARTTAEVTNARPQANWRHTLAPVPILVYHDLGNAPASEPYPGLYMPYATFEREMAWLHSRGYEAVTLDELINDWERGGTLPAKPIVITFDNGYPPQVTEAPRVMSKYGWPGVLNEITQDHLYPAQIRSVLDRGWEVDSHSLSHPDLTTLDGSDLRAQVVDSRRFLQRTFHIPVNSFCYPSSKYDATVVAAVKAAGYEDAVTEGEAYATPSDSPFLLPRFEMTTGLPQLEDDLAEAH